MASHWVALWWKLLGRKDLNRLSGLWLGVVVDGPFWSNVQCEVKVVPPTDDTFLERMILRN